METSGSLSSRSSKISHPELVRNQSEGFLLEMVQCIKQLPGTYEIQ